MTTHIDVPVSAWQIRPGDRLVPPAGTVRVVREATHRDRSLLTVDGFDALAVWDLDPHDTVTLRCTTGPTDGWDYVAGRQPGDVLDCSCVYRRQPDGTWDKAITLPDCAWCNYSDEED